MTPPKCRICGAREHNHRCQAGTAAQRVAERRAAAGLPIIARSEPPYTEAEIARSQARIAAVLGIEDETGTSAGDDPPGALAPAAPVAPPARASPGPVRRWHTEDGDDGEPRDVLDVRKKPARFYAPVGECKYCDRRREAAKRTMRAVRERGEA